MRLTRYYGVMTSAVLTLLVPAVSASAQSGYDPDRLGEEGFVPADGVLPGDAVPGGALMLAAYAVFFALLAFYVAYLVREQRRVSTEVIALRDRVEALDDRLEVAAGARRDDHQEDAHATR